MMTAEEEVLLQREQCLRSGQRAWLCTAVRATDSSPRPVGLDIGSKTPLEIAVAIMAQLTQLLRRGASPA